MVKKPAMDQAIGCVDKACVVFIEQKGSGKPQIGKVIVTALTGKFCKLMNCGPIAWERFKTEV
jgi:hypothetical protein